MSDLPIPTQPTVQVVVLSDRVTRSYGDEDLAPLQNRINNKLKDLTGAAISIGISAVLQSKGSGYDSLSCIATITATTTETPQLVSQVKLMQMGSYRSLEEVAISSEIQSKINATLAAVRARTATASTTLVDINGNMVDCLIMIVYTTQ
jgi:hypothetical protein